MAADSAATAEPRPLALASPPPPPPLRLLTSQTRLPPSEPGAARRRRPCRPGWEGLGGTRGGAAGSACADRPLRPPRRPVPAEPRAPPLGGDRGARRATGRRGAGRCGGGGDQAGMGMGWRVGGRWGRAGRGRAPVCTIPTLCAPPCAPPNIVKRVGTIRRGRGVRGNLFIKSIPSRNPAQPPRAISQTRLAKKEEPVGQQYRARVSQTRVCVFSRVRVSTGGEGIGQAP